jgi:nitroreductase
MYLVSDEPLKSRLLSHQNGNRGFGHLVPHVGVITANEACFFDASERHEPYIDGGLFAMSLSLALRAQGVGSCCLNWCVRPKTDRAAHSLLGIARSERIIMLMAIGYPASNTFVPRSPRKSLSDILIRLPA